MQISRWAKGWAAIPIKALMMGGAIGAALTRPKNEKRSSRACQQSKRLDRLFDCEITGWVGQGDRPQRNPAT
ncbi:hypothetical protein H6F46_06940 [Limnothrix sp. FACHB-1083]|uniref:hypothetical protein n=1 Tax=unclassified Limnothrix TaxID=2632864 RepID=UPI00167FF98F|nr:MULTISPECIES: hypothetical protein [unclassified Limnothrix]MBD2160428.1 hypothetical protein [Limnothrix sp. FACHB-1083]MBD2191129.1 hypothetical protein [Limnothrix sp. FACHB-1088]